MLTLGETSEMASPDSVVFCVSPVYHDVLGQARLELHQRDPSRCWRQGLSLPQEHTITAAAIIIKVQAAISSYHTHSMSLAAACNGLAGTARAARHVPARGDQQLSMQHMPSIQSVQCMRSMHLEEEASGVARVETQGLGPRGWNLQLLYQRIIPPAGPTLLSNLANQTSPPCRPGRK